jgi:hypothetical protein
VWETELSGVGDRTQRCTDINFSNFCAVGPTTESKLSGVNDATQ